VCGRLVSSLACSTISVLESGCFLLSNKFWRLFQGGTTGGGPSLNKTTQQDDEQARSTPWSPFPLVAQKGHSVSRPGLVPERGKSGAKNHPLPQFHQQDRLPGICGTKRTAHRFQARFPAISVWLTVTRTIDVRAPSPGVREREHEGSPGRSEDYPTGMAARGELTSAGDVDVNNLGLRGRVVGVNQGMMLETATTGDGGDDD